MLSVKFAIGADIINQFLYSTLNVMNVMLIKADIGNSSFYRATLRKSGVCYDNSMCLSARLS